MHGARIPWPAKRCHLAGTHHARHRARDPRRARRCATARRAADRRREAVVRPGLRHRHRRGGRAARTASRARSCSSTSTPTALAAAAQRGRGRAHVRADLSDPADVRRSSPPSCGARARSSPASRSSSISRRSCRSSRCSSRSRARAVDHQRPQRRVLGHREPAPQDDVGRGRVRRAAVAAARGAHVSRRRCSSAAARSPPTATSACQRTSWPAGAREAPEGVRDVVATDLDAQRDWVRRREADLRFYKVAYEQVLSEKDELTALVREHFARFDEWRTYIRDLERRLGLPLSGVSADQSPRELPARRTTAVKVAFLVNDLQLCGGIGVVVRHARGLAADHGFDVSLVLVRDWDLPHWSGYDDLPHLHVHLARGGARPALRRRGRHLVGDDVQPLHGAGEALRVLRAVARGPLLRARRAPSASAPALTLDLPVAFITEARWIQRTLGRAAPRRAVPPRAQRDRQGRLRLAGARRAERLRAAADPDRGQPDRVVQGRAGGRRRRRRRCASRGA